MVFTKFSRIPLQTFSKTLSSGYAQSVVAASHSSYTTATTSLGTLGNYPAAKFARTSQLQSAFQTASSSGSGAKASHTTATGNSDGGLQAYVAAWQHAQQTGDDSDWRQHQFARRIGWKGVGPQTNSRPPTRKDSSFRSESLRPLRASADRSYSENNALEVKKNEDAAAEAAAVAKIDEAIAQEIKSFKGTQPLPEDQPIEDVSTKPVEEQSRSIATQPSSTDTTSSSIESTATSVSAEETIALSAHIVSLAQEQRFKEIPAAFESIQRGGNVATIEAYNALLVAAIRIPADKNVAFNKALEVYAHLISRKVIPNHDTHLILIQLFLGRALANLSAKRNLAQRKQRYGGMEEPGAFLFKSQELDQQALLDDDSLSAALKQFRAATTALTGFTLPADLYYSLIKACAEENLVPEMLDVFKHMEENKVNPHAGMFPAMIQAFASSNDLASAAECYEGYRRLAVADNQTRTISEGTEVDKSRVLSRTDREDNDVHAALVKAYLAVDKALFARRFYNQVIKSYETAVEEHDVRLSDARSTIVLDAFVQHSLDKGSFAEALDHLNSETVDPASRQRALGQICTAAADANEAEIAQTAFSELAPQSQEQSLSAGAMVAMSVRQGQLTAARPFWEIVRSSSMVDSSVIDLTTMYAVALLQSGMAEDGLLEAGKMFRRVHQSLNDQQSQTGLFDEIDEAIALLGGTIMKSRIPLSTSANLSFLRLLDWTSTWTSPAAIQTISAFNPEIVASLDSADLALVLKAQATFLLLDPTLSETDHSVRFAHLMELALAGRASLDAATVRIVNQALPRLQQHRQDLVKAWYDYLNPPPTPASVVSYNGSIPPSPLLSSQSSVESSFDPYAHNTDLRGSTLIADTLDKMTGNGRNDAHLADALSRFRQMRRIGRHPRYITYSKLIASAAKVGRKDVVHDVFNTACRDVPLLPHNELVKYGWYSILDSMVSAYLVMGDRGYAAKYHAQLLDLGSAPSANTFGLYITTLKESTKTFDEATEAVKIFHHAIHEGVEPTSFLYNALIGKLGKARRIDDCLQYFAEMRAQNIRPTSVTYGTIVNALCRVSDERFAEEMFDEMESMPNYKPRPAPYNSLIQYFLNTKRDRSKVLSYYNRMRANKIAPTMHTYKLLIDAYASLDPIDMDAAEEILDAIRRTGQEPEAVHFASLIHAKGCVLHDLKGAQAIFDSVLASGRTKPQPCLYQALLESMVANHKVDEAEPILKDMSARNIEITPYIANALIHGWAGEGNISNAQSVYDRIGQAKREPSTYEAMARAFLASEDHQGASEVVSEMLSRGYPAAVSGKVLELVGGTTPTVPAMA
ncbi:MAG: hypothetical protein Q9227_002695 [Pyrenula ochraceoflavens]